MTSFKEFIIKSEQNTVGYHNDGPSGGFLSTDQTGSEANPSSAMIGHPGHLPGIDQILPSVTRTGIVTFIDKRKNPIFIHLSDGTKLYFTIDEFKRIQGTEPERGKTMVVSFQRNPADHTDTGSKINSCKCY